MKRKGITKTVRFAIFARDGFACRYCGRQADDVALVIDHMIPVAQDGTNETENLITSCVDCNQGKAAKTVLQITPTADDRLRLAQERHEQLLAAERAQAAIEARRQFRDLIIGLWCDIRGTEDVEPSTINVMCRYAEQYGVEKVASWIEQAQFRWPGGSDEQLGRYVSAIRRRVQQDMAAVG